MIEETTPSNDYSNRIMWSFFAWGKKGTFIFSKEIAEERTSDQ